MADDTGEDFKRTVCWFSCGAASAIATKIALARYENCVIVYQDTGSEHPDNIRFLADCEKWYGQKIQTISSEKYADIWEVFKETKYLVGVAGARCTAELKRKVAERFLNHFEDREILGYTVEERARVERFRKANPERRIECPLIDDLLGKDDCLGWLERVGIEIPAMYKLGYRNNNCIGCVKGGAGYWNKIRKTHPEIFDRMAKVERSLDAAINKKYVDGERVRVFLDELPEGMGLDVPMQSISCGLFCASAADDLEDDLQGT
jgi:3'-phosphoadenosine 5'-phosphosulfate sulfotransferase (PAPS reductase)/FAD synthetase